MSAASTPQPGILLDATDARAVLTALPLTVVIRPLQRAQAGTVPAPQPLSLVDLAAVDGYNR